MAWPRWWYDYPYPPRRPTLRASDPLADAPPHPPPPLDRAVDWVLDWALWGWELLLPPVRGFGFRWWTARALRAVDRLRPTPPPTVAPLRPLPGAEASPCETLNEVVVRLLLAEPALAPFHRAAGLLLLLLALGSALVHRLLPAVGLHRNRFYDRAEPPALRYDGPHPLGRARAALVARLGVRPPRQLLWWAVQFRSAPGRLLRPAPTLWFVAPLLLATAYDAAFCIGWVAAWGPFRSNRTPYVGWDDRLLTWPRLRHYLLWLERHHLFGGGSVRTAMPPLAEEPLLWRTGRTYPRSLELPPPVPRSLVRPELNPAVRPVAARWSYGTGPRPYARFWEWIPFALVGPQLLAAVAYGRELRRFRRWPAWGRPLGHHHHWDALLVRSFVRKVAVVGLLLVPAHAYATLFMV